MHVISLLHSQRRWTTTTSMALLLCGDQTGACLTALFYSGRNSPNINSPLCTCVVNILPLLQYILRESSNLEPSVSLLLSPPTTMEQVLLAQTNTFLPPLGGVEYALYVKNLLPAPKQQLREALSKGDFWLVGLPPIVQCHYHDFIAAGQTTRNRKSPGGKKAAAKRKCFVCRRRCSVICSPGKKTMIVALQNRN